MKTIVVGGGAAGMMAAVSAAESGEQVLLIEKNEKLGKKLFITGKGRCNVTNASDMDTLFDNVCTNSKFLYSAFYGFSNEMVMDFFEKAGCPLKTERGNRVFPVSDHSSDVIAALSGKLKALNVRMLLNTRVRELLFENNGSGPAVLGVKLEDGKRMEADRVILCTGGLSYPTTGSTGDGHRMATDTGHNVTECRPALVPFETVEKWCGELMGLTLKNVGLTMICNGKRSYSGFGEMLFTHFGVSGPLVLSASSFYTDKGVLQIDLKPAMEEEQLDRRILRDFEENKNKIFKNSLSGLFPAKLIPVMVMLSGIPEEKKVSCISREERRNFVHLIKNLPLTIKETRGFAEAVITKGGVSVKDVNPSTMESKKIQNLYFAGEILDLDALTGGYNLQIAWSTGYLAGISGK